MNDFFLVICFSHSNRETYTRTCCSLVEAKEFVSFFNDCDKMHNYRHRTRKQFTYSITHISFDDFGYPISRDIEYHC